MCALGRRQMLSSCGDTGIPLPRLLDSSVPFVGPCGSPRPPPSAARPHPRRVCAARHSARRFRRVAYPAVGVRGHRWRAPHPRVLSLPGPSPLMVHRYATLSSHFYRFHLHLSLPRGPHMSSGLISDARRSSAGITCPTTRHPVILSSRRRGASWCVLLPTRHLAVHADPRIHVASCSHLIRRP